MYIVYFVFMLLLYKRCNSVSRRIESECPANHFKLAKMERCHPFLTCADLHDIKIVTRIGTGAVKDVFLTNWKGFPIVTSVPVNLKFLEDYFSGVEALKSLNPSKQIVQFLGYCDKQHRLFTEYHHFGNAADFFGKNFSNGLTLLQSLEFCHQYALILNHLHNGPAGRRVFCDSNSLDKLLSQLLIADDLRMVLNDVDALPNVNSSGIKCGHLELTGDFVAPEQLWSQNGEFENKSMLGYNEKTDIWKAASVCDFFINKAQDGEVAKYRLFEIHKRCKNRNPSLRPTAEDLVQEYISAKRDFGIHSEL